MLICWSPIAFAKEGFLEDEKGKYLPKNVIVEALESAVVFYYVKKDKQIEKLVTKYLMQTPKLKDISKEVKKIVFNKYPILKGLEIPQKIYLPSENISVTQAKVYDLSKKDFIDEFKLEVYKGIIENITIKSDNLDKIKTACKAYTRALSEYEHKELKGSGLEEQITQLQNSIANEWEIPLRIGYWTNTPYKGDLFFFWRIKEIREYLLKRLDIDIRPKDVIYLPRTNEFLGWGEIKD